MFTACLLLSLSTPLCADTIALPFEFDLVPSNSKDLIIEPPGDLKVTVRLDTGSKKKSKNPLTAQTLRDAATPALQEIRKIIVDQIELTNDLVKTASDSKERENYLKVLNTTYQMLVAQAKHEAETKIHRKWEELLRKRKELLAWRLEIAYEISRDTFGIGLGVAEAVGSSGFLLALEIVEITDRVVSIGSNVRSLIRSESNVRKDLVKYAKAVETKMNGGRLGKVTRIVDKLYGVENKMESSLELHQLKLTAIYGKAQSKAVLLQKGFEKEALLRKRPELSKNPGALAALDKLEVARNDYLKAISAIGKAVTEGEKLQAEMAALLKEARKPNPNSTVIQKVLTHAKTGYDLASSIRDFLEPVDAAIFAAETTANIAVKVVKKIKLKK